MGKRIDPDDGYRVGPGRPPREHQFKKGQPSANPFGRPRKKPEQKFAVIGTPLADLVLKLAYEPVPVREAGREFELPMIEANLRMMGKIALNGNSRVQAQLLKLHKEAHDTKNEWVVKVLETAIKHKEIWGPKFRMCEERGLPVPNILPHPDDVIIDGITGTVRILGPQSYEDVQEMKPILEMQKNLIGLINEFEARLAAGERKTVYRKLLPGLRRRLKRINSLLPPRLQHLV
jgi:hypothetical protein